MVGLGALVAVPRLIPDDAGRESAKALFEAGAAFGTVATEEEADGGGGVSGEFAGVNVRSAAAFTPTGAALMSSAVVPGTVTG